MTSHLNIINLHTHLHTDEGVIKAVDGVSFSIDAGQTYCLVGESGSGKSITALSVMQLLPEGLATHPEGRIEVAFEALDSEAASQQASTVTRDVLQFNAEQLLQLRGNQVAMIFQEPMTSLNPVMTVGEQIAEAITIHQGTLDQQTLEAKVLDMLEQVQIADPQSRINSYPHQLSGGQRQRVMIAMALSCEPQLLIADEPTTALDVTVQAEILALIKSLQASRGMSVLFITHDLGVVAQIADTVGVMQQGKLVETGTVQGIFQNPQHPYTQKLIAALPQNLPEQVTYDLSAADTVLEVSGLRVWFPIKKGVFKRTVGHVKAVDDVSFQLRRGEVLAVVGESGSGKSTIGRAILRLLHTNAGEVHYNGHDLLPLSAKQMLPYRRKIQVVFQDPMASLNPRLDIYNTLVEPLKVHGLANTEAEQMQAVLAVLAQVKLEEKHLWRFPHELSGGQKQRVGLARALMLDPEVIVCDEITSALDVSIQAEILQLLLDLRQQRKLSLIFITHNIGVVEYIADTTLVLQQGKLVEHDATSVVCTSPSHPYTQALIAAVPRI